MGRGWRRVATIPRQSFTRQRWHFTLKTGGSHVEALQLETRERLECAVTLYSMVSWRLLWMTYQVRIDPDQSPTVAFSPAEITVLERVAATQNRPGPRGAPCHGGTRCGRWPNSAAFWAGTATGSRA